MDNPEEGGSGGSEEKIPLFPAENRSLFLEQLETLPGHDDGSATIQTVDMASYKCFRNGGYVGGEDADRFVFSEHLSPQGRC